MAVRRLTAIRCNVKIDPWGQFFERTSKPTEKD
jgi:hypothetical protein